jgi:putative RecB family exonuclease
MEGSTLSLSPSSASDFKSCPQLFKFRKIDQLPEPVSAAAARGSLVHAALERLFLDPPVQRTPERAMRLLEELWGEVRRAPEVRPTGMPDDDERAWLDEGRALLNNYFRLEDPSSVRATRLEWWVEYELPQLHLRGIIDRLEETRDGAWILTDYKTGRIPGEARELQAFFGLRFYALVCWRAFDVIPKEIRLVYLSDPAILTLHPHERMLVAFEKQVSALGDAIRRAVEKDDWRTRPTPYCMSCSFQTVCPAWESAENESERSRDRGR